jgi:hypothetical protein
MSAPVNMVAVDIGPDAPLAAVKRLMEQGETDGRWHYDEGSVTDGWLRLSLAAHLPGPFLARLVHLDRIQPVRRAHDRPLVGQPQQVGLGVTDGVRARAGSVEDPLLRHPRQHLCCDHETSQTPPTDNASDTAFVQVRGGFRDAGAGGERGTSYCFFFGGDHCRSTAAAREPGAGRNHRPMYHRRR